MKYWQAALGYGFGALVSLLVACFIYGLFNRFEFWHGASPPGIDSGVAYAWFAGIIVGPFVFFCGAIAGIARVWWCRRRKLER